MKVFIDGKAGTTGLRIYSRLESRKDVELIKLPEEERKDLQRRRWALNNCDMAFLCLPDAAAREAAAMIENEHVVVLDTSTAHRTQEDWAYGFPELSAQHRAAIAGGKRIAVPGCHASGFIALAYPLVEAGVLPASALLSCFSLTGYSGGGKQMIGEYETAPRELCLESPRIYGLPQQHKHLPEMQKITGLAAKPIFVPTVSDFYSGMLVTVPLFREQLCGGAGIGQLREIYRGKYQGPMVRYTDAADKESFLAANGCTGKDTMEIMVAGCEDRILLMARYDNLGKGASGAALQCMNIVMGMKEETGLVV